MQRVQNLEYLSTLTLADESSCEAYFLRQYEDLGDSARGALRLALLTEEIPETLFEQCRDLRRFGQTVHQRVSGWRARFIRSDAADRRILAVDEAQTT